MKAAIIMLILATPLAAQSPVTSPALTSAAKMAMEDANPALVGGGYFGKGDFAELDEMALRYARMGSLFEEDGKPRLAMLMDGQYHWFGLWPAGTSFEARFTEWQRMNPDSPTLAIFHALSYRAMAWRGRGNGLAGTVTPEGWKIFNEQDTRAWQTLMNGRTAGSVLPAWYETAIDLATDLDMNDELRPLFDEGIKRFPTYFPLQFSYLRHLSPRWGGSYEQADAFIREQVDSTSNIYGDALYARLYWAMDQSAGGPTDFFENSLVSWKRMRRGFGQLVARYPKSAAIVAAYAAFACRVHDGTTYVSLRPKIESSAFWAASPDGFSVEVCDERFMKRT